MQVDEQNTRNIISLLLENSELLGYNIPGIFVLYSFFFFFLQTG